MEAGRYGSIFLGASAQLPKITFQPDADQVSKFICRVSFGAVHNGLMHLFVFLSFMDAPHDVKSCRTLSVDAFQREVDNIVTVGTGCRALQNKTTFTFPKDTESSSTDIYDWRIRTGKDGVYEYSDWQKNPNFSANVQA